MVNIILEEVGEIIVVAKSYCRILVLAVMVIFQWSFSAVTNAIVTYNDHWTAIILGAGCMSVLFLVLLIRCS